MLISTILKMFYGIIEKRNASAFLKHILQKIYKNILYKSIICFYIKWFWGKQKAAYYSSPFSSNFVDHVLLKYSKSHFYYTAFLLICQANFLCILCFKHNKLYLTHSANTRYSMLSERHFKCHNTSCPFLFICFEKRTLSERSLFYSSLKYYFTFLFLQKHKMCISFLWKKNVKITKPIFAWFFQI